MKTNHYTPLALFNFLLIFALIGFSISSFAQQRISDIEGEGYGQRHILKEYDGNNYIIKIEDEAFVNTIDLPINKIVLYPNPATDLLNIESDDFIPLKCEIYSNQGQLIQTGGVKSHQVSVVDLPKGLYYIFLRDQKGEVRQGEFVKVD